MFKKIIKKIKEILNIILIRFKYRKEILLNINKMNIEKYSKVIVFENNFGFKTILMQRPQQIALNMPNDVLFVYHSKKDKYEDELQFKKIKENLYMMNLNIYRKHILKHDPYVLIYSTDLVYKRIIKKYNKIIFEYIDDINEKLCGEEGSKRLKKQMDYILSLNPIVIVTSDNLLKKVDGKLITNGCDYNHFHQNEKVEIKFKKNLPVIGYYGAIASWFDYELIREVAKTKKYNIVLIGIEYDNSLKKSGILKYDNVYYLGKKEYSKLPKYLAIFDIAIIPFILNEITNATNPVKLFEYMSGNKPIVTTDLPECRKYKSVLVSRNHQEFILNLDKAYMKRNDKDYIALLDKEAKENTWESKCKEYISYLEEFN